MIEGARLLGARLTVLRDRIEIEGGLRPTEDVINAGNSGQVLRFLGAISALLPCYTVITGDASIRHRRPALPLIEGICQLGGWATSSRGDGHAPLIIRGCLRGGSALIEGQDSQPVSALLIACAFAQEPTHLMVKNPGELPWIGLTLSWLDRFHIPYINDRFSSYQLKGSASIEGFEYVVPADWSSALYPVAAAILTDSEITLRGVDFEDAQGDKKAVEIMQQMGACVTYDKENKTLHVHKGSSLKGIKIDMGEFIDAITIFPVLACYARGSTEIVGAEVARVKECDRIASIAQELRKMGAIIEEKKDGMVVHFSPLHGASLFCHDDHRMALALSVAALTASGTSVLEGTEVVKKSFPDYFSLLKQMGGKIE
jgi:3-phosphoshikimate 1-carboxyvinyltransferase